VVVALLLVWSLLAAAPPLPATEEVGFSDVTGGSHAPAINALAERGVFEGTECGDDLFCPGEPIERQVMAVWLVRALGDSPAASTSSRFADVKASAWWAPFAEQLAIKSITAGCKTGPLRFCPDDSVTRGQMATFLVRAFKLAPASAQGFADTSGNTHEANINALAVAGVTAGCKTEPLRFCPRQPVTRAQMATFLHRATSETPTTTTTQPAPTTQTAQPVQTTPTTQPTTATQPEIDVPNVKLTNLSNDSTVNFRSIVKGKVVLLWFWAEW